MWDWITGIFTIFQFIVSLCKSLGKVWITVICISVVLVAVICYILIERYRDRNDGKGDDKGGIIVTESPDDTKEPRERGGIKPNESGRNVGNSSPPFPVDIDGFKAKIEKLETDIGKLISDTKKFQNQNQWLQTQNDKLDKKNDSLQTQNDKLDRENDSLQTQNDKLDRENDSLQTQNDKLDRENDSLQTQNDKLDRENDSLRAQNETLHSEKQRLQADNIALQKQLDESRSQPNPDLSTDSDPPTPPPFDPARLSKESPQRISHDKSSGVRSTARSKNNQGYNAFYKPDFAKAIALFKDGIQADPKAAIIHYNLGCTYLEMSDYAQAISCFNEAIRLDPNYKKAYYNLAIAYFGSDNPQEAIKAAYKALKIDRNYQKAQEILAVIE